MVSTRTVQCNGKTFSIRMGWNAIRLIEKELQRPIQAIGLDMMAGRAGITELGTIFWAGLETARLHSGTRPEPYSIDEIGNIIDEVGSRPFFKQIYPELLDGIKQAFPKEAQKDGDGKKGGKKGDKVQDPPTSGTAQSS